jgi:hypothetical protein
MEAEGMADDPGVTLDDIQLELIKIENEMGRAGRWELHDRWKSGRLLIQLRNPATHYLPKGRLTTVGRREPAPRAETLRPSGQGRRVTQETPPPFVWAHDAGLVAPPSGSRSRMTED